MPCGECFGGKMKKIFLILITVVFGAAADCSELHSRIDAVNNAYRHNNIGLDYVRERYYYGAIKEFQIAINLNPDTQATSVYYNNLGKTYIKIGYPGLAAECFEKAVKQYPLNFEYYDNLVDAYARKGVVGAKLKQYKANRKSYLDDVIIGLLYEAKGNVSTAVTVYDDFCAREPDLVITPAVKKRIRKLTEKSRTFRD